MSAPKPFEASLLRDAAQALDDAASASRDCQQARNVLLACVAAELSGVKRDRLRIDWFPEFSAPVSSGRAAAFIAEAILRTRIPPPLAVASLAQPLIPESERRKNGAYYTDFRLAQYAASKVRKRKVRSVLDCACGTGILLAAVVLHLAKDSPSAITDLIGGAICGADLSEQALKGTFLSLATLTDDTAALRSVARRLRVQDSLLSGVECWSDIAPAGFDVVVGNPPWEKLKVTRHEWLRAHGAERHYGQAYGVEANERVLASAQTELSTYVRRLETLYRSHGGGEQDLFKFFLELSLGLCRAGGDTVLLLPAGLIRSQGTACLRRFAFERCSDVEITVLENRARFFSIDTRFKFLTFHGIPARGSERKDIRLVTTSASEKSVKVERVLSIPRLALQKARPDLSVPEVRSEAEWKVFRDFVAKGIRFGDPDGPWRPKLMREVDMTRDRPHFRPATDHDNTVPLIEGRMVHQFRIPAKRYVSGTGRRACWLPVSEDVEAELRPQFRYPQDRLPDHVQERVWMTRAGFCDITGQTNERTMLAARVPGGTVCGNKVPTVIFADDDNLDSTDCWLAIVNSIPFDWMLRRVVTTTVNYFLLLDLPLPRITPNSPDGRRLVALSRRLSENRFVKPWERAEIRSEIDWRVLAAFGHDSATLALLLNDFPLLDRSQPPLPGEQQSTITRDFLLLRSAQHLNGASRALIAEWQERVSVARTIGAVPYVPSHLVVDDAA